MNFKYFFPGVIFIALGIYSCSPALFIPTAENAVTSDISLDTLLDGRNLYINKCSSCHNLFLPEKYSIANWDTILPLMQKKAKINDNEINKIKKYLISGSKKD